MIGLTATPPHMMTAEQAGLHQELFGAVDLEVSAPALVRDGHLAPYPGTGLVHHADAG